jgi:hypothetical protein
VRAYVEGLKTRASGNGGVFGDGVVTPSYVRQSNSWDTLERMDTEIAKLGLRGVTVVAASVGLALCTLFCRKQSPIYVSHNRSDTHITNNLTPRIAM